jgi:protein gp37
MSKTKIEWCDYTINPVKGLCPVACDYCYARRMYKRFKWNPEIRYDDWVWQVGSPMPKGSRIFVGSTIDLFHKKTVQFLPTIMEYCEAVQSRTFIFLTKCPENLPKEWPDNCHVGVSVTNRPMFIQACERLKDVNAKVKFISFEPLLESVQPHAPIGKYLFEAGVKWVIIGRQTPLSASTMPHVTDIQKIIDAANEIPIPVFLKDNLKGFLPFRQFRDGWKEVYKLRQELP